MKSVHGVEEVFEAVAEHEEELPRRGAAMQVGNEEVGREEVEQRGGVGLVAMLNGDGLSGLLLFPSSLAATHVETGARLLFRRICFERHLGHQREAAAAQRTGVGCFRPLQNAFRAKGVRAAVQNPFDLNTTKANRAVCPVILFLCFAFFLP